jgi:hypothetical protein
MKRRPCDGRSGAGSDHSLKAARQSKQPTAANLMPNLRRQDNAVDRPVLTVDVALLEAGWALPASLLVCGLVFLGDATLGGGPRTHGATTFILNLFSLPIGGITFLIGALDWHVAGHYAVGTAGGMVLGVVLVGRSLREVPWTGAASLAAAIVSGWALWTYQNWSLSLPDILGISAGIFLVVFIILYLIELPLRIAGLFALPRPLTAALGVIAIGIAVYLLVSGYG